MRCALVGFGYWGQILVKKLIGSQHFDLKYICDQHTPTHTLPPDTLFTTEYEVILADKNIIAVFIAVPPNQHYRVARQALDHGKHVWLEKPGCVSIEEFQRLKSHAKTTQRVLHIDFVAIFNPRIMAMREYIQQSIHGGKKHKLISIRENQRRVGAGDHHALNLVYDLGVHDLSIIKFFYPEIKADEVTIHFERVVGDELESLPFYKGRWLLRIEHPALSADIYLSWWSARKRRDLKWSDHKTNLQLSLETDNGVKSSERLFLSQQDGTVMDCPFVIKESIDALEGSLSHFYNDIEQHNTQWSLLEVAEFCHRLMHHLKCSYSSP